MNQAKLHRDNMEEVKERLENAIVQSTVETIYDGEDCFITVVQKNNETGNKSEWSFCVDFGTGEVMMLEPVEDVESFSNDNEVYRIIKNFLNGGSSREKRMNRPDYDSGKPIKITGKGNKIGNAFNPGDIVFCDNGYGSGKGFQCKIVRKVDKSEVPGYQNSNAGDYYEVETVSKQLEPQRFIKWENRLTPVKSSCNPIKSSKYIVEVGNEEIKFDDIEEANETFRQAVENNDVNTSIKIYVDEGYSNKHLKLMRSERGKLTSSRNPIKSSVDKRRVKEELNYPDYNIENPEKYYNIQFDINWEDISAFAISWNNCIDIDPREIVSVEYDESVPSSYQDAYNMDYDAIDGAYLVKFKDGTSKSYGWTYGGDKLIPMTSIQSSRKPIKSGYYDEEYRYPEGDNKYVVEILDRRYEGNPYYTYLSEDRWDSPLKDAIIFDNWEEANKRCEDLTHSLYSDGLGIKYWPSVIQFDKVHNGLR